MRDEGGEEFVAPDMNNDNSPRSNIIGFINPVYAKKSRSDARFSTCTLEVGAEKTKLRADPNVLCQASYFDELLTETNKNGTHYLPELDSDAVSILIDYLYTGTITYMEPRTLQNVLLAARKFGLDEVKTKCLEKLTENLASNNCLEIRAFAKLNNFDTLRDAAFEFVKDNFTTLANSNEFLNLEFTNVEDMISACNRNLTTDEVIFKAILRWVKHDQSGRESHVYGLLTHVNLVGLFTKSPELVNDSFENEVVLQGKMCQKMFHVMVVKLATKYATEQQQSREFESQSSGNCVTTEPTQPNLKSGNSSQTTKRSRLDRPTLESETEEMETDGASRSSSQSPKRKTQSSTKKNKNSTGNGNPTENVANRTSNRDFPTEAEGAKTKGSARNTKAANNIHANQKAPEDPTTPKVRRTSTPKTAPFTPRNASYGSPKPDTPANKSTPPNPPFDQHKITDKALVYISKNEGKYYLDGYAFQPDSAHLLAEIKLPRRLGSLAYHDDKVFHIGGTLTITDLPDEKDLTEPCKLVKFYQRGFSTAVEGYDNLELLVAKKNAGICICEDYLYVTGGCTGSKSKSTNVVERLQLNQGLVHSRWESMERSMEYIRSTHGVAVLNGKIYAFGGVGLLVDRLNPSPKDKTVDVRTAECFDPSYIAPGDDQPDWKLIAEMNHKRPYVMSGVMDNKIYAIGGSIVRPDMYLRQKLSSVEYYDPIYNRWTLCAPMTTCRSGGAVVVQDPLMYVIGGDKSPDPSMEVYDHRINKWVRQEWPKNLSKTGDFSSAIVVDLIDC